jgi:peptidoglycan/LPS O-acetylase OafA/YrhL
MVADRPHDCSGQKPSAPNGQLPSLTSLRGLAALWVVLYHYSVQCFPNLDAVTYSHLIHKGYLAVDMFFMLSGFVMTHVYHRAFSQSIASHYRSFMVARIARLYPLHLLILILFVATALSWQLMSSATTGSPVGIPLRGPESISAFVANIFMLQGLDAGQLSWNYPAWSISVEFMAYLAFPFALPAIWRAPRYAQLALALVLFAGLAGFAFLSKDNFDQWDGPIVLLRCMPEFLLGSLLYCVFRSGVPNSWLNSDIAALGIVAITISCLQFGAADFLIVWLFAALILIAVVNTGVFAKVANVAPLIWLGEISYSLYLIHGFVQFVASKLITAAGVRHPADLSIGYSLALMLVMIGICLVSANASYFGVEVVWRRYLRDLLGVRQTNRAEPVAVMVRSATRQPRLAR